MMKLRLAAPEYVIDIDPLADELGYVTRARRRGPDRRDDAPPRRCSSPTLLARRLAIFTDAERVIADPVVRNRGTIGGALCQADPSEDLSAVCAAVGAQMVIRVATASAWSTCTSSIAGRTRPRSARPRCWSRSASRCTRGAGSAYEKVDRRVGDWAVVAAGAALELADGTIARAGIALAAAGGDITSHDAEAALAGEAPSDELFARAGALAAAACEPVTDQRGSAEYKRHVAGVLTERVLRGDARR